MFYFSFLFQREDELSCLPRSSRTMQQYVVDQFCKEEEESVLTLKNLKGSYKGLTIVKCERCLALR